MPTLKIIKKRIVSVKNTQKITRAMKLVSAAKLRRATDRAHASRPYEKELSKIVSSILNEVEWSSALTEQREVKKTCLVVFTTDRGLAGSLNSNVLKQAAKRILEVGSDKVEVIALGKKGNDYFKKRGIKVRAFHTDLLKKGSSLYFGEISKDLRDSFLDKSFDSIEAIYPQFRSALVQNPTLVTLLPFRPEKSETQKSFLMEPQPEILLNALVPMLLDFQLYRFYLESVASEHGSRMAAMESATKNARDMIDRLTLERNRARQAAITKELMEIIGGAEALSA